MKYTNVCKNCENKLTDEELEREADLCDDCQYRKEVGANNNQMSLCQEN